VQSSIPIILGCRATFNLTNAVRFDTSTVTMWPDVPTTFGQYNSTLATCDGRAGRCMQFGLTYEF
jgi:hypothetical protein